MDYPLRLRFKVLAIGHQLSVEDARGNLLYLSTDVYSA